MLTFIKNLFTHGRVIGNYEDVIITGPKGTQTVRAKIDTGAELSSLDSKLAEELGLLETDNVVERRGFKSGLGKQHRDVVRVKIELAGVKMQTVASVTDRSHMAFRALIGRHNLQGFLVRPDKSSYQHS